MHSGFSVQAATITKPARFRRRTPATSRWSRFLLPNFIKLPGGLQQIELRLLTLEIGVKISHPLVAFHQARFLDFPQIDTAFDELRLQHGQILLRELQLQARDLPRGIALPQTPRLHSYGRAYF